MLGIHRSWIWCLLNISPLSLSYLSRIPAETALRRQQLSRQTLRLSAEGGKILSTELLGNKRLSPCQGQDN
jgi:hypothetical protein